MAIAPSAVDESSSGVDLSNQADSVSIHMSDPVRDLEYARNAVTLTFDLSGHEQVRLEFEAMEYGDEPHAPPGRGGTLALPVDTFLSWPALGRVRRLHRQRNCEPRFWRVHQRTAMVFDGCARDGQAKSEMVEGLCRVKRLEHGRARFLLNRPCAVLERNLHARVCLPYGHR